MKSLRRALRHSVRARLISIVSVTVGSVVCLLTLVMVMVAANILRNESGRQQSQSLEQSVPLLSNFLDARETNISLWASSPLVDAVFKDPSLAMVFMPSLRGYLARAKEQEPWIAHVFLMQDTTVLYDDSDAFEFAIGQGPVQSGVEYLAKLSEYRISVFNLRELNPSLNKLVVHIKRPFLRNGKPVPGAFMVVLMDFAQIDFNLFSQILIGKQGFVSMVAQTSAGVVTRQMGGFGGEEESNFQESSRSWRSFTDIPDSFGNIVLKKQVLAQTPFAIVAVASMNDIHGPVVSLLYFSALLGAMALVASVLSAFFFASRLTKPIKNLVAAAAALERGNLTDPIVASSRDEIGQLASAMESTRKALASVFADLESRVAQRTQNLLQAQEQLIQTSDGFREKSEEVSRLLNNSGQGFLSFSKNLQVDVGHSQECQRIFQRLVLDLPLPELLCPVDLRQRQLLAKTLPLVIESAADPLRRDAYIGLLPAEYQLGQHWFEAAYKPLDGTRMMLILTDVTDAKWLKEKLAQERTRLEFVVNALENRDDLLEMVHDFDTFRSRILPDLLSFERQPQVLLSEIFRHIHTFKSLFAQASLPTIPAALHELETCLSNLRDSAPAPDLSTIKRILGQTDLGHVLEQDLALLREKLGNAFFSSEREIRVPASKLSNLEAQATALYGSEARMLELIRRLRFVPLEALIAPHFKATEQLAARQEKQLAPITYTGDSVLVDPETYGPFCKSLVHIFRNAVDHGIEDADTRFLTDKNEVASILCEVRSAAAALNLRIADDGRGIGLQALRAKAQVRGLLRADVSDTTEDPTGQPAQQLLQLIFADGFSTREEVSTISGRGVGLSAVQQELTRLGGRVHVSTNAGQGTAFEFTLPYRPLGEAVGADTAQQRALQFLAPLPGVLKNYCQKHLHLDITLEPSTATLADAASQATNTFWRSYNAESLYDFTTLVSLGSGLDATLGLSLQRDLLLEMTRRFEPDFAEAEIESLAESVGAEIANTLFGNATVYFTHLQRQVALGTPQVLSAQERVSRLGKQAFCGFAGQCVAGGFVIFCLVRTD